METTTDVVIVGAGLAGLAAGSYLARGGRRVTVLERASSPLAWRMLNGLPALVVDLPKAVEPIAPRVVIRCDLSKGGQIAELHLVLAPEKLRALARNLAQVRGNLRV